MNTETYNKFSLKPKDEDLRRVVQGFKLVNLNRNQSEIALIAGISKSSIAHNKNKIIDDFWSMESDTPDDDKNFILERSIEIGSEYVLKKEKEPTLSCVFGVILGTYLKVETKALDNVDTLKSVWTTGRHITNVYKFISRHKKKKSVSISSENKSSKYLLKDKDKLDELFLRSDDYLADKYNKRWTPTELLIKYIQISNNKLLDMISVSSPILKPFFPSSYMSPSDDAKMDIKKGYFKNFKLRTYNIYPALFVNINDLKKFEINSVFSLLARVVEINKDVIHIPVKHESKKSPEYLGRNYNIFCSLRSHERLQLGFIGYDMSAALQTISLQLIKGTKDNYPMLWDYTNKPGYKSQIRTEIATDLNIPIEDVKSKLTAFAHGSVKGIKRHKYYEGFQVESNKLRKSVLDYVRENDPKVLEEAIEQSKRELPEGLEWLNIDNFETPQEMRDKASVFFFVWTWYERQIRQAMLDALDGGLEVHDAVYSRKNIDPRIIEEEIYAQTRFSIKIEKEMP